MGLESCDGYFHVSWLTHLTEAREQRFDNRNQKSLILQRTMFRRHGCRFASGGDNEVDHTLHPTRHSQAFRVMQNLSVLF
jgi:hypothetical protein